MLQHVSIIHPFLLPNNSLLYGYYHILFILSPVGGHLGCFHLGLLWIMLLTAFMYHCLLFKFNNFNPSIEVKFFIRCNLLLYFFSPDLDSRVPPDATRVAINVLIKSLRGLNSPEKKRLVNLITVFYSMMAYEKLLAKCPSSSQKINERNWI